MEFLRTITDAFEAATESPNRGSGTDEASKGAYWCHDCGERRRDTEVDVEPPSCPECGEEMTFERSMSSTGCAC